MALTTPDLGVTVKREKEEDERKRTAVPPQPPPQPQQPQPQPQSQPTAEGAVPPAIDFPSACGAFGWTTIGSVHLPFIMRGEERFIAVRMVECKVISSYADLLPWTVFTCTNIKSYYVTESEARLLNEINGFHCDFQFGCRTFTPKDVVVRLKDTIRFYEFLETCKGKLRVPGANPLFSDQCGFFLVNYAPVPFVKRGGRKWVPLNMVCPEGTSPPSVEGAGEWDLAYFRFLCSVANLDPRRLSHELQLCPASELQDALGGAPFEEWWPNVQYSSSKSENLPSSNHGGAWLPHHKWVESDSRRLRDKGGALGHYLGGLKGLTSDPVQNGEKAMFVDNFLTTPPCHYPYPINYERCKKSDSTRARPYPPPPPLVRVGSSTREGAKVAPPPSVYPYIPAPSANPWLARFLEPDWLQPEENHRAVLRTPDVPENLSRECYEQNAPAAPPPHYPTPPQSSPLQPLPLVDCANMDLFATRSTPNGLLDLCSPPPSPDARTPLLSGSAPYQPHVTRLVQVDARYVVAINVEPHKYNSALAVPVCDVVNKFLGGASVQSAQIVLETVFGLHLFECNSFQQEAFSKHNFPISAGSKLVSLTDLKNCLYQLKCLLVDREGVAKRWCGSAREC